MSIFTTLATVAEVQYLQSRDLPNAPDGRYDSEVAAATDGKNAQHSKIFDLISDVQGQIKRGAPIPADPAVIAGFIDLSRNPDSVNDRLGTFQNGLGILSKLPPTLPLAKKLGDSAVALLYNSLPHPPSNYMVPPFREADGGGNNLLQPDIGRAGQHYARSVQGRHPMPAHALPDPGLVFDVLLKRRGQRDHPGGNSAMTFAFASLVIHSLFRTDPRDWTTNNTSSYLDLSPLYGINQAQQDLVRIKNGKGLLGEDAFAEDRMGFAPAAASALLVIFSRNHNYIARTLLSINERRRWVDPATFPATADGAEPDAQMIQQDNEIFNTARLVNCGHFMSMIFGDYVSGFLGMVRDGVSWNMNPFDEIKLPDGAGSVGRGEGNHVSVEFNLLYRWHATLSEKETAWTEGVFKQAFGDKPYDQITKEDFGTSLRSLFSTIDPDPKTRTFAGLKRDPKTRRFADADILQLLTESTESIASAFRGQGTPACMRPIEVITMTQARSWNVCTMNEFRAAMGLKRFETFEEWNPDPEIAGAARTLYGHVDNLELYPGIQAEETMPLGPGSGFCAGYTLTRAILADAICLVRGDRFYTTDFTPQNLTSWGFQDCARDPNNGAYGAALPRLLLRHLPLCYSYNSAYALFPFFPPSVTLQNLTKLGVASQYDFTRPVAAAPPKILNTMSAIRTVFNNPAKYHTIYEKDMRSLTEGYGYFLNMEDPAGHDAYKRLVLHAVMPDVAALNQYAIFYRDTTRALIKEKSYTMNGTQGKFVDIIGNVINLTSVHWVAEKLCGIPLKTKSNPNGMFTEREVYDMFSVLFSCVFQSFDPEHGWILRDAAQKINGIVSQLVEKNLEAICAKPGFLASITNAVKTSIWPSTAATSISSYEFMNRLAASGKPVKELYAQVIGLAVGSCCNYAQACAQTVNFYLDDKYAAERERIIALSKSSDPAADALIMGYIREAQRLDPQFPGLFRDAVADDTIIQGGGLPDIQVKKGDRIFAAYKNAHLNPADYPDPTKVDPTRITDSVQGIGFHGCPGAGYVEKTMPQIVKSIFALKNLRRAPGPQGQLATFNQKSLGTEVKIFLNQAGGLTPWPGSLLLQYDE